MNERRAAVRLLQPSCLEQEASGAALSGSSSPRGHQLAPSPAPRPSSARRRSVVFPSSFAEAEAGADASDGVRLGSSPPGGSDEESPHRSPLSVPLTLLSLNNGGGRHMSRTCSRDTSPMVSLMASRESSFSSLPDGIVLTGSSSGAVNLPPWCLSSGLSGPVQLSSPSNSGSLPTLPAALATLPAAPTRRPPRAEAGSADAQLGAAASAGNSPAAAVAVSGSAGAGSGSCGGITLPGHLCSHRPPTPLVKEEDLMASLRHLSSPARRRSRFASAADAPLVAAAAAAIAAEEAGLLESSSGIFTTADGGARGSVVLPGEPPVLRPLVLEQASWGPASPSASRRSCGQLITVPEETSTGPAGAAGRTTPRLGPPMPCGGAGPAAASPGAGRRHRASSSTDTDVGRQSHDGEAGLSGASHSCGGGGSGTNAHVSGGASATHGLADDALSSFMGSFGPGSPRPVRSTPGAGQSAAVSPGGGDKVNAR